MPWNWRSVFQKWKRFFLNVLNEGEHMSHSDRDPVSGELYQLLDKLPVAPRGLFGLFATRPGEPAKGFAAKFEQQAKELGFVLVETRPRQTVLRVEKVEYPTFLCAFSAALEKVTHGETGRERRQRYQDHVVLPARDSICTFVREAFFGDDSVDDAANMLLLTSVRHHRSCADADRECSVGQLQTWTGERIREMARSRCNQEGFVKIPSGGGYALTSQVYCQTD